MRVKGIYLRFEGGVHWATASSGMSTSSMSPVYKLEFNAPIVNVPPGSRVLEAHDWFFPCAGRSEGPPKWLSTRGGNGLSCKSHQSGGRGLQEIIEDDVTDSWEGYLRDTLQGTQGRPTEDLIGDGKSYRPDNILPQDTPSISAPICDHKWGGQVGE